MSAPLDWGALGGEWDGDAWEFKADDADGWVGQVTNDNWFAQCSNSGAPNVSFATEADAYQFVAEMQRLGRFVAELRELAET